jgi:hypothetical protein
MIRIPFRPVVLVLAACGVMWAQQPPADPQPAPSSNGGWRRMSDPAPADQQAPPTRDAYGQVEQQQPAARPPAAQTPRPAYGIPAQLTLKPGTFVTMRINQGLASNHNAVGDSFSGTLMQPIVVDGIVVAQRGEMVYGKVAEAQKVKGVHRLGVELTSLTLADGSQAAVHTQLISRQGPRTPGGQEAGVITSTTAGGAVIGAIAGGGAGAAGGAGIGAAVGIIGVLATRNHPSVIYPETMLTFQTENALTINTGSASGAYRYVGPDDYGRPGTQLQQGPVLRRPSYVYGPGFYNPYYYPSYGWGYPYYGWGWGPSVFIGGGFGFGHFGGFHRFR